MAYFWTNDHYILNQRTITTPNHDSVLTFVSQSIFRCQAALPVPTVDSASGNICIPVSTPNFLLKMFSVEKSRSVHAPTAPGYWVDMTKRDAIWPKKLHTVMIGFSNDYIAPNSNLSVEDFSRQVMSVIPILTNSNAESGFVLPVDLSFSFSAGIYLNIYHRSYLIQNYVDESALLSAILTQTGVAGISAPADLYEEWNMSLIMGKIERNA